MAQAARQLKRLLRKMWMHYLFRLVTSAQVEDPSTDQVMKTTSSVTSQALPDSYRSSASN
jgi:hypothetical protein